MRSPSAKLAELLDRHGLCSKLDLASCEPFVRRLCQDLPDFDSVWLDALVQQGTLTSWQAEILQSAEPDHIRIGEYTLRQQLGRRTFLALNTQNKSFVLVSVKEAFHEASRAASAPGDNLNDPITHRLQSTPKIPAVTGTPEASSANPATRLLELTGTLRSVKPPESIILPQTVVSDDEQRAEPSARHFAVFRHVAGWSLDELLVRGGRLPWPAVAEIGRDLLAALAWLEAVRLLHGDIVLRNTRLTPSGKTVLTCALIRRLLQPGLELSENLTLRDCEGIAPEQIGSGRPADQRSELYALGCLLWQLLSSRPVVLTADPVSRLVKLREQDVPEIRTFVPDCPEWMARAIQSMTRRTPDLRPSSAMELLKPWKSAAPVGNVHCRQLIRDMPDRTQRSIRPARRMADKSSMRRWTRPAAALALLATVILGGVRMGLVPKTLRLGTPESWLSTIQQGSQPGTNSGTASNQQLAEQLQKSGRISESADNDVIASAQPEFRTLPGPDANGIVRLRSGQQYLATGLNHPVRLRIETATATEPAVVLVPRGLAWQLTSLQIELVNISVRMIPTDAAASLQPANADSVAGEPNGMSQFSMMVVTCGTLILQNCVLQNLPDAREQSCVAWLHETRTGGTITATDCIFFGGGNALRLGHPPAALNLQNVLLASTSAAIRCDFIRPDDSILRLTADRVTQRFGASLADIAITYPDAADPQVEMICGECVFAPTAAILRLALPAGSNVDRFQAAFRLPDTGNPTVVPPGTDAAIWYDTGLKSFVRIPDSQVNTEGLLIALPEFRGAVGASSASTNTSGQAVSSRRSPDPATESELVDFEGPKLTTTMPGIDRARLPTLSPRSAASTGE